MPYPILYLLTLALSACALASALAARQRRAWAAEASRQAVLGQQAREKHRQTVQAVTGGRLRWCEPAEMPALLTGERLWTLPLLDGGDVALFRQNLREIAARRGFSEDRLDDLCACVSEAAANAIRHSQGGVAQVWATADSLTVLVTDCGRGIAPEALCGLGGEGAAFDGPQAGTLGFRLMLAMSDTLALCTGVEGTQLLLTIQSGAGADTAGERAQAA